MKRAITILALFTICGNPFSVSFVKLNHLKSKHPIIWAITPLSPKERKAAMDKHLSLESDSVDLLVYSGYVVKYSKAKKSPLWTTHRLSYKQIQEGIEGGLSRNDRKVNFKQDLIQLEASEQVHSKDYTNTGFDRGHMTPSGDFKNDSVGQLETFYLTNITPQTPDFNQIVMLEMENKFREWVRENKQDCQVITGALYQDARGRGMSNKKVDFPSSFYKILYANVEGKRHLYCFLVPHQFAYPNFNLSNYQVSLDEIESLSGEDFLDKLDDESLEGELGKSFY